jgi:hypothetical protein
MGEKREVNDQNIKKKNKSNRLNLRISDDEFKILNLISFEDEETVSQIVRKAIKQYDTLRKNSRIF